MIRRASITQAFGAALLVMATFSFAAPVRAELTVIEYACALAIVNRQPAQPLDCVDVNPIGSFYLWTRVRGDLSDLQALEEGRAISIKYRWKRYIGASPEIETIEAETEIGAGSIPPEVLSGLKREVVERGFFDWRTWTRNEQSRRAGYAVNLLDSDYRNIPCRAGSAAGECKILVKVGR